MGLLKATETTELTEKPQTGLKLKLHAALLVELSWGYGRPPMFLSSRPN